MKNVVVIGAGITGLMTALELFENHTITVIDAGPNPVTQQHYHGATYSGLDARHISFTETAPWTSSNRYELITTSSKDKGWLCIPKDNLKVHEQRWIAEFKKTAKESKSHNENTDYVINLNKKSIKLWEELKDKYVFLNPYKNETVMPIICRSETDLLEEFDYEHNLDSRVKLYRYKELPQTLKPFNFHLTELGGLGYFTLYGTAYHAKTICLNIIQFLSKNGVNFVWNTSVSDKHLLDDKYFTNLKADAILWCSGVSDHTVSALSKFNILLGGVIGCWVEVDNPGIEVACKIYGPEPINYLNVTPGQNSLLISGGYGFVGDRSHSEASILAKPIMDDMINEIKKWLPDLPIKNRAYCIRPATPTGVPTLVVNTNNETPIIITVGHAAGGFTQSPLTAKSIKTALMNID